MYEDQATKTMRRLHAEMPELGAEELAQYTLEEVADDEMIANPDGWYNELCGRAQTLLAGK